MTLRHASYLESMTLRRQPSLVFGPGVSSQLSQHLEALLGRSPALSVTFFVDSHLHGQGAHRPLGAALEAAGASVSTWVTSPGEPKEKTVRKAIAFTRATRADLVVCLGGRFHHGHREDSGDLGLWFRGRLCGLYCVDPSSTPPARPQRLYPDDGGHRVGIFLDQHFHPRFWRKRVALGGREQASACFF